MPEQKFHEGCPFVGMNPKEIMMSNGEAKGLRLHLTLRDAVALGIMLLSLAGVYYALKADIASNGTKLDAFNAKIESHLSDADIHPSVLARQALIDERVMMKQAEQTANFKRLEDQIIEVKIDVREIKASLKGVR
jgi:hypothetical protein